MEWMSGIPVCCAFIGNSSECYILLFHVKQDMSVVNSIQKPDKYEIFNGITRMVVVCILHCDHTFSFEKL